MTEDEKDEYEVEISFLVLRLTKKLDKQNIFIKTISLKIRYSNFATYTKSKTLAFATNSFNTIYNETILLFNDLNDKQNVRLVGVHLSSFTKNSFIQLKL